MFIQSPANIILSLQATAIIKLFIQSPAIIISAMGKAIMTEIVPVLSEEDKDRLYQTLPTTYHVYKEFDALFEKTEGKEKRTVIFDFPTSLVFWKDQGQRSSIHGLALLRLFIMNGFEAYGVLTAYGCRKKSRFDDIVAKTLKKSGLLVQVPPGSPKKTLLMSHAENLDAVIVTKERSSEKLEALSDVYRRQNVVYFTAQQIKSSERLSRTKDNRHFISCCKFAFTPTQFSTSTLQGAFGAERTVLHEVVYHEKVSAGDSLTSSSSAFGTRNPKENDPVVRGADAEKGAESEENVE
ncbi:unnamed protein product [Caenorhabditis auriculariae]|uniref:Uncharacterized protein n=1 Tax=Caenorhabditis auriculariae TaxID=2777116 RepID=A0A8S1H6Y2_9PELO|nr:unnamed protein product [Caenorhabditis auriculariae]